MYVFTRSRRIEPGEFVKAMEWTVEVTEAVKRITGREVTAWTAFASPEAGTVVWTMWAEHLADIETTGDKLAAEPEYVKLIQKGSDYFEGPVSDSLSTVVFGEPDLAAGPPGYVVVVTATAANGRLTDAVGNAVEIAEAANAVGSQRTMVCMSATGPYGGLAWITPAPDLATIEADESALNADANFLSIVDKDATAYAQGATQTIYRRVA